MFNNLRKLRNILLADSSLIYNDAMSKVLVIDDEKDIVDMIETLLELDFDAKVVKAYNGQEAVDALASGEVFDLIISDVNMPLLKGPEVFKQNSTAGNFPFVLMTGSDELDQVFLNEFSSANPNNSVIAKPWDQDEFLQTMKKILAA